jgi:DNA-binding CsgD family transcriptional regulator
MGGLTNLLRIGLLFAGLPMPRPIPLPSNQPVASRTNSPAAVAPRRWAPNIPGTLIRALSQRLGVDGIAAMRIALLYGDIEWQAASGGELRYSASDYARRMGIHRHTVQADLRRLEAIGAIGIDQDPSHGAVLQLHGLGCLSAQGAEPCRSEHQPCRPDRHPPCRSEHHPPVDGVDNPLSMGSTTLEKGLKTQEKKREEQSNPNPNPSPPPEQTGRKASEPSGNQQPPEPLGPSSSEPGSKPNLITQVAPRRASGARRLVRIYQSDHVAQCHPVPERPFPA